MLDEGRAVLTPLHLLSLHLPGSLGYVVGKDRRGVYARLLRRVIRRERLSCWWESPAVVGLRGVLRVADLLMRREARVTG